jgi:hypothetical protein
MSAKAEVGLGGDALQIAGAVSDAIDANAIVFDTEQDVECSFDVGQSYAGREVVARRAKSLQFA